MNSTAQDRLRSAYRDAARYIHPDFAEHEADRKWRNAEMVKLNAAYEARDIHEVEKILQLAKARIPDQDEILSFQSRLLRRSIKETEFELYRAALEWTLVDPIVIDGRADLKSEQTWKDRVEPFHQQVTNLITFCRRLPVTLLADDVGLGSAKSGYVCMDGRLMFD